MFYLFFFFFSSRRRHTRWPRDWSSDVCSSDLPAGEHRLEHQRRGCFWIRRHVATHGEIVERLPLEGMIPRHPRELHTLEITAATVVEQIVNDAARDAVLEHRIGQPFPQLGVSA